MVVVEVQYMEVMWIILAPLTAYVSKLRCFGSFSQDFFLHSMSTRVPGLIRERGFRGMGTRLIGHMHMYVKREEIP